MHVRIGELPVGSEILPEAVLKPIHLDLLGKSFFS
jgi:hypothetical protein